MSLLACLKRVLDKCCKRRVDQPVILSITTSQIDHGAPEQIATKQQEHDPIVEQESTVTIHNQLDIDINISLVTEHKNMKTRERLQAGFNYFFYEAKSRTGAEKMKISAERLARRTGDENDINLLREMTITLNPEVKFLETPSLIEEQYIAMAP
jgi:hypothetical protein